MRLSPSRKRRKRIIKKDSKNKMKKILEVRDKIIEKFEEFKEGECPLPQNRKKTIKEKLFRKDINFRIQKSGNWRQRFKFKVDKLKKEMNMKESQNIINIVHIAEDGDVYLIPAFQSSRNINYLADKSYRKKYNHSKRISIHYFDGKVEEALLCDSFSPMNFKVNPSILETAKHAKEEFENAYETFEKDLLRTTAFSTSQKQVKMYILMFIAGVGIGSLVWGGAFVIMVM